MCVGGGHLKAIQSLARPPEDAPTFWGWLPAQELPPCPSVPFRDSRRVFTLPLLLHCAAGSHTLIETYGWLLTQLCIRLTVQMEQSRGVKSVWAYVCLVCMGGCCICWWMCRRVCARVGVTWWVIEHSLVLMDMCVWECLCERLDTTVGVCVGLYVGGIQWAAVGVFPCGWL